MPDWNLALIDVASAWVAVALPRAMQANLLARSGLYASEAITALGIEERQSIDPVKHTSLLSTLLLPAFCSLAGIPVMAAGKQIEIAHIGDGKPGILPTGKDQLQADRRRLALRLAAGTAFIYLLQALVMALLMTLLAKVYLAGAPVAARCGQLCLRMAMLSLLPLPPFDSAIALWTARGSAPARWWVRGLSSVAVLALLITSPALDLLNQWVMLGFFRLGQLVPW
jgi:hypothetical protein